MKKTSKAPQSFRKKTIQGVVVSAKMDKTVVVMVVREKRHPVYLKSYKISQRYYVHDEKNAVKKGDVVIISEAKPMSRLKRWKLVKIISVAQ